MPQYPYAGQIGTVVNVTENARPKYYSVSPIDPLSGADKYFGVNFKACELQLRNEQRSILRRNRRGRRIKRNSPFAFRNHRGKTFR